MSRVHGIIEWYEPVHKTISHLPEVKREIRSAAQELGQQADLRLMKAKHRTGDSHIEVVHQRQSSEFGAGSLLDSYVMLVATDDVDVEREGGWPAAMSIEMGATNGGGGLGPLRGAAADMAKSVRQR